MIENVIQGTTWKYAVVGVGININQVNFDEGLINPVSLKQITGKDFDLVKLAKELYKSIMNKMEMLNRTGVGDIITGYNQQLYRINEKVRFKKESEVFETTVKGVLPQGRLLTVDTVKREFNFGEVEWLL